MNLIENAKRLVAEASIKEIQNGSIIGLGSGSTVTWVVEILAEKIKNKQLAVHVVAASIQTELLCIENNIPLTDLNSSLSLSLTIDGADQVDPKTLNVIKGGGAALTREKILASASKQFIVIVDENKLVKTSLNHPVPIEVLPFAYRLVLKNLEKMGANANLRIAQKKNGPIITDNGNFVIDADFGEIQDPQTLERQITLVPGVLEVGLFTNLVSKVYVGFKNGRLKIIT